MGVTFKLEGLEQTLRNLEDMSKATNRNVIRRALKKAADPIAERAQQLAPRESGRLARSIGVSFTLSRSQRWRSRENASFAEIFIGTTSRLGVPREFGSIRAPATPFMRPAWESMKNNALVTIKFELIKQVELAAARAARKAARLARG